MGVQRSYSYIIRPVVKSTWRINCYLRSASKLEQTMLEHYELFAGSGQYGINRQ